MPLSVATERVFPDEKAYSVAEVFDIRPPDMKVRRYQVIEVNRDDEIAQHWTLIGDADPKKERGTEFQFFALWEHTVGECWDIAEKLRGDYYWKKRLEELRESSTLINDAIAYAEVREKVKNRQSVIGPGIWQQRSW